MYLRSAFLSALTSVLADHSTFWADSSLRVERNLRKKIALFPVTDPQVINLSSASG